MFIYKLQLNIYSILLYKGVGMMWILGLLVFLPLLTAGLLFFIQGDRLRDAVVKMSAAAIAMLSLFVAFTCFGNKVVFRLGDSFLAQGAILVDILVALVGFLLYLRPVSPVLDSAFGSNSAGSGSMV